MHVPSYQRCLAAALSVVLAGFAGTAAAVEFNEKLQAPMVKDPAVLRSQAHSFIGKFAALQAAAPHNLVANRALAAERFDLVWQIQQAIDAHRPLGDLSGIGLQSRENSSYHIDYNAYPHWDPPEKLLAILLPTIDWHAFRVQLVNRGFRDEDVTRLEQYVATHDPAIASRQQSLPLALSFSKVVKKYDRIKRPVDDAVVLSYLYQRAKLEAEQKRLWAEGLLNTLDAQRARILLGYFSEMRSTGVWAPSDRRAGIDELLRLARLPNFDQLATAEALRDTQGDTP